MPSAISRAKKIDFRYAERFRQSGDGIQRNVRGVDLDFPDRRDLHPGGVGERLLKQPSRFAPRAQIAREPASKLGRFGFGQRFDRRAANTLTGMFSMSGARDRFPLEPATWPAG